MSELIRPSDYKTVEGITSDQDNFINPGGTVVKLMGYSIHESAGSPGAYEVSIVDGATGSGGTSMAHIEGGASTSTEQWYGPDGIAVYSQSISIDHISGTVDVTVYYKVD